jgi:hypothetical protein
MCSHCPGVPVDATAADWRHAMRAEVWRTGARNVICDVHRNPFCPVTIARTWRTMTVGRTRWLGTPIGRDISSSFSGQNADQPTCERVTRLHAAVNMTIWAFPGVAERL